MQLRSIANVAKKVVVYTCRGVSSSPFGEADGLALPRRTPTPVILVRTHSLRSFLARTSFCPSSLALLVLGSDFLSLVLGSNLFSLSEEVEEVGAAAFGAKGGVIAVAEGAELAACGAEA